MYTYFIAFSYVAPSGHTRMGNTIITTNVRVEDVEDVDEMNLWITNVQDWIGSKKRELKEIIVVNFKEI